MEWIIVAAAGLGVALSIAFWQQIVTWANRHIAAWLEQLFGEEVKQTFLLVLAGVDRGVVMTQRAAIVLQDRLLRARLIFRQVEGGRSQEKIVKAEMQGADGQIIEMEVAEVVPWHELPDEVREKFIRRQTGTVELELKLKD